MGSSRKAFRRYWNAVSTAACHSAGTFPSSASSQSLSRFANGR